MASMIFVHKYTNHRRGHSIWPQWQFTRCRVAVSRWHVQIKPRMEVFIWMYITPIPAQTLTV